MERRSLPDWAFPPPGGFKAEDLDHIPDLPAHTELIDGSLVFVSPQASFHMLVVDLLVTALRRCAPDDVLVRREMSVILDEDLRPEPDVCVIRADAEKSLRQTFYRGSQVLLAIEVVSPESRRRDRQRKPVLYAEAGIPHFWLVEDHDEKPVVHVFELQPATRTYAPSGVFHDRLKLTVPFDIDIDLTEIERI
ncbi:Uma2 family endonuclease [Nonomuraea sp. SMC257]|uniref:Uma2 family endonuclease n=2 Tax=Nonomuraea montanisoli TaxID=2741721 RepID=A0A7Y6IFR7_9ACTN|nr:Uma2 family endonuclease [Nonomuraea montanisoli]NUW37302.1 Uma2 family endonuclease [Nonomuraea montanisoli]